MKLDSSSDVGTLPFARMVCLGSMAMQALLSIGCSVFFLYVAVVLFGDTEDAAELRDAWVLVPIPLGFMITTSAGAVEQYLSARWYRLKMRTPDADLDEISAKIKKYHAISLAGFALMAVTFAGLMCYGFFVGG